MMQRRLAWFLRKDDMKICEVFHIEKAKPTTTMYFFSPPSLLYLYIDINVNIDIDIYLLTHPAFQ